MNGRDRNRGRRRPSGQDSRNERSGGDRARSGGGQDRMRSGPADSDRQQNGRQEARSRGSSWKRREKPKEAVSAVNKNGVLYDRPRWIAPKQNTGPLPVLNCTRCGGPITDLYSALTDKNKGGAVHFDCVMAELAEREAVEEGDTLSYIGGGRFGIVHFNKPGRRSGMDKPEGRFTIKKIFEWEEKETRAEWRTAVADHYSLT